MTPPMTQATADILRKAVDDFTALLDALRAYGYPVSTAARPALEAGGSVQAKALDAASIEAFCTLHNLRSHYIALAEGEAE